MFGPGAYVPDPTEGIIDVHDLPQPILVAYDHNHEHSPCPRCGPLASRHTSGQRTWHDLGDVQTGGPGDRLVTSSSHSCSICRTYVKRDLAA